jgi:DHA1 family solute carrier family 18 vesicular amine transporter 1/2
MPTTGRFPRPGSRDDDASPQGSAAPPRSTPTSSSGALLVAFVALATDMLIYGIAVPVLPMFPAVAAGGGAVVGILFATYAAGLILATPLAGRWVDAVGPRGPMLIGLVVLAAATVLFSVVDPLPLLVLARAAQGVSAAISWVAGLALVAATSPIRTRARNLGLVLSAVSIGVLLGPPLGGLLADLGGRHLPFVCAALLALVDAVLRVIVLRGGTTGSGAEPARMRDVARVRGAAAVCVVVALGAGLLAILEPVLPLHLARSGHGPLTAGLVFGAAVLASACATPVAGSLTNRMPIHTLCLVGAVIGAAGFALLGWATGLVAVIPAMALVGLGGGTVLGAITPAMTTLGERSRPPAIGAAFALFNLAYAGGLLLGPAISGPLTQLVGFGGAMPLLALLVLLTASASAVLIGRRLRL